MKKRVLAIAVAALSGLTAQAGERTWYAAIEGGVEFQGDVNFGRGDGSSWAGLVTIGKGITSNVSVEAEAGYRSSSYIDAYDGVSSDVDQISLMVNAVYEAPISKDVSLEIGVGIGGDLVDYNLRYSYWDFSENELELAAQLKLGLNIAVTENTELVANYRYVEMITSSPINDSTLTVGFKFDL